MKSKGLKFVFVFVIGLSLVLSACGAGADSAATEAPAGTESPVATEASGATEAPAATDVPVSGDVVPSFVFTNTGSAEICELYLSPVGLNDWGVDQLGGATIVAASTFTLKNIPAGSYDVKAVGCNGQEAVLQLDIQNQ